MPKATLITSSTFISRIGTARELPRDRHFAFQLLLWRWRHKWNKAQASNDYRSLDILNRQYDQIQAL